jgi:nonribosomal peptide synthetase protein BlmVI
MTDRRASLLDRLGRWREDRPDKTAYRFLADGESQSHALSYADLHAQVLGVAAGLRARCVPGDRVALVFSSSLDFVTAFLGVLGAGCVAVPLAAPAAGGSAAGLGAILADADPALVLTDLPVAAVREWVDGRCPTVTADGLAAGPAPADGGFAEPGELAFLQYTSGSTGAPKGVMVTHANLLANQEQMRQVFGQDEDAVLVSWLPFFHDMGLIGGVLHPLYLGATAVLMPPEAFLRKPLRWLRAISDHRGTVAAAPDFGYDLCLRRVSADDAAGLDLSSWRVACNGSEPVSGRVLTEFSDAFAPFGFSPETFAPCYGLAEATLLVSGSAGRPPRLSPAVSCGAAVADVVVVRDGLAQPEGAEGEIWVHGPNVAAGYWRAPEATQETFRARLPDDTRAFLRTGDLGVLLAGELYVTGRLKDVLIVRGRNHHPQDVEATVQRLDRRLVEGSGAVFSTDQGLVAVQAVRGPLTEPAGLADRIRQAVVRDHGLALTDVVLVRPAGVPRTTSGKVRRSACRDRYLAGDLPVVHRSGPPGGGAGGAAHDAVTALADDIAGLLELPPGSVGPDQPLTALGLDSLRAMRVQQLLTETRGVQPPLEELLGGASVRDLAGLAPRTAPEPAPAGPHEVTRGQQALWFLSQWNEGSAAAYVLSRAVEMASQPDEARLRAAADALVARHPQLRSRFHHDGARVRRAEWRTGDHPWLAVRDAGPDPSGAIAEEAARPVDLENDPLFRMVLFHRTGQPPVLLVVAAHIIADLHSFSVILSELGALYGGASLPAHTGMEPAVAAENAFLASDEGLGTLAAWAAELRDAPTPALPRDRERTTGTRFAGDAETLLFSAEDARNLTGLADRRGCTPFTVLLAAYHAFLDRICGQSDIVIGVPVALRSDPRLADAVGYLINTVPIRIAADPADRSCLTDRIETNRGALSTALSRARVPLPGLVERLGLGQDPSPLFQVSCGFYDDRAPGLSGLAGLALEVADSPGRLGAVTVRPHPLPCRTAVTELDVTFGRVDGGLLVRLNYSTEVFDPATARQLGQSLRTFVSQALAAPDTVLSELPLTAGPVAVAAPGPVDVAPASLAAHFVSHVRDRPDAPAMVHGARTWTYGELGAWSQDAARALPAAAGDGGGTPVAALFFDGGPHFIVSMLAALRAGYAFMPLMPDLPADRLAFMMADGGASAVFAAPDDVERVSALVDEAGISARVVAITGEPSTATGGDPLPVRPRDAVAYVVYTSGTTGRPKGVVITDDSVLPLLSWQAREFPAGPGMRMAQTCALSFDVGLQELLTVLMFGGALCLPLPGERYSAQGFSGFLNRDGANALYATPTFVRELTAYSTPMSTIKVVQIAGEMLTSTVVERVRPLFAPGCKIFNGYGPTETSINCAMYLTAPGRDAEGAVLPVGRPTGLARLYVLDRYGKPLPPMLHGEVYIGGPGVGAGYRNRPEENRARFLPDTVTPGGRMYRTGDRGRMLPDGNLVITGRLDDQVKIRGYRIEPSEVEAQLRPLVADCVVLVDRRPNGARLLAFITGPGADPAAVRLALAERLPGYMMPTRLVALDELPRSRNGKLDTAQLIAAADRSDDGARDVGGMLPVIQRIWCEALDLSEVDADANFFEIGGSSLSLARVVSLLKDATSLTVAMPRLFQYPTARALAAYLESLQTERKERNGTTGTRGTARRVRGRQRTS